MPLSERITTMNELEICQQAFDVSLKNIQTVIANHFDKDEVFQEVWSAIKEATKEYLEDHSDQIIEQFIRNLSSSFAATMDVAVDLRINGKKKKNGG
jgi:hypothetical protein